LKTTPLDNRKQTFEPSVQRLDGKELIIVRGENLPPLHDGSVLQLGAFGTLRSQDSSVGLVTGYELGGLGSNPERGSGFFSSPHRAGWLLDPPSLLASGYWKQQVAWLIFYPEEDGSIFSRNLSKRLSDYKVSHPRKSVILSHRCVNIESRKYQV
jgi:hypothetical protein